MSALIRWGVLGTAHINRRLIPALRSARRSTVLAVASRDEARARSYAREWSIEVAHGSYDALLRDRTIDAVYIPLPNTLHVEWTLRAIDAGKHVLCEKPLALVPDDVDRIAAVARARSLVVAEAFMFRHEPLIERLLDLVREGAVGPVRTLAAGFTYAQHRSPDVRLDPALGGGSLWDVGCYAVNALRLVMHAEPEAAFGFANQTDTGVDDSFTGLLRFPGGVIGTLHSSFRATYRAWIDVHGADGVLRVSNAFRPTPHEEIDIRRGDDVQRVIVHGSPALFVRQVEDFVAAALDGREPTVSLEDSRGNAAALAALHESARSGRTVAI